MALYSIESEHCLGISHSGAVTVNGESAVELSDEAQDFLYNHMDPGLDMDNVGYEIEITQAIITMAESA